MTDSPHHRPGLPEQRATIAIARAVLAGNDEGAVEAAAAVRCPICLALSLTSYWVSVCAVLDGDSSSGFVAESTRVKLLAAARAAQAELDSMSS
jgi:hypothetical protein